MKYGRRNMSFGVKNPGSVYCQLCAQEKKWVKMMTLAQKNYPKYGNKAKKRPYTFSVL